MTHQPLIDAVLLAGEAQLAWLNRNPHPPLDVTDAEAVRFYGASRGAIVVADVPGRGGAAGGVHPMTLGSGIAVASVCVATVVLVTHASSALLIAAALALIAFAEWDARR